MHSFLFRVYLSRTPITAIAGGSKFDWGGNPDSSDLLGHVCNVPPAFRCTLDIHRTLVLFLFSDGSISTFQATFGHSADALDCGGF